MDRGLMEADRGGAGVLEEEVSEKDDCVTPLCRQLTAVLCRWVGIAEEKSNNLKYFHHI